MGFHLKGGSALIWQIFFLFITKKLVIFGNFCFSSVSSTRLAKIVGEIRQIFDIKINFQNFKIIINNFFLKKTWNEGSTERRIFETAVNEH
jgi:hypothetical protein